MSIIWKTFEATFERFIGLLPPGKSTPSHKKIPQFNVHHHRAILNFVVALELRLTEVQEVSYRQSDKIIALRSVAKALESENELLSRDNGRQMVKNREENGGTQVRILVNSNSIFQDSISF